MFLAAALQTFAPDYSWISALESIGPGSAQYDDGFYSCQNLSAHIHQLYQIIYHPFKFQIMELFSS